MTGSRLNIHLNDEATNIKEQDPQGLEQHEIGVKLDAGKPRVSLVIGGFARALGEISVVATYGAKKNTDYGWAHLPNGVERYTDAMLRHYLAEGRGEVTDPDSGLLHAAQTAWNALARLELILRDRNSPMEGDEQPQVFDPTVDEGSVRDDD